MRFLSLPFFFASLSLFLGVKSQKMEDIKTLLKVPLNSPALKVEATVIEFPMAPGDQGIPPHTHPGPVVGYVLEGEFLLQVEGRDAEIISNGQAFYENDGDVHLWGANASNSTVARITVTLFGRPGEPILTYVENKTRDDYQTALSKAKKRGTMKKEELKK